MTPLDELSAKQLSLINHANTSKHLYLAGGAIRSGKTFSTALAFAIWSLHKFPGHRFVLAGVSVEAIRRNYADEMVEIMQGLGFPARYRLSQGVQIIVPHQQGSPSIYHLAGATDRKSTGRIQGLTIAGAMIDEIVLLPKDFVLQLLGRQSTPGGKVWATFNPENPAHWLRREIVMDPDRYNAVVENFTFRDNPSLTPEVMDRYERTFTGHWHARLVRGQWAAPSGAIFQKWTKSGKDKKYVRYAIGLDWAVSGVFAALLFGVDRAGHWVVCDELIHDARKDRVKTEDEIVVDIRSWLKGRPVTHVYLDPSTPATFKRKLRQTGVIVRNGDNDVGAGLMTTASRLANSRITVHQRCAHLCDELDSYQWDPDRAELGEDAPIKSGDHAVDALRYFAHTTGKMTHAANAMPKPRGW